MRSRDPRRPRPPLDMEGLERLALFYVGRYATTRAKLRDYLARKVKERGWGGSHAPEVAALADRFAERGYVDDAAFAAAKASSLQRRGLGERRVSQALRHAGIEEQDAGAATEEAREKALETAIRFARRKRIGPFAQSAPDRDSLRKAFAAMMRAGHSPAITKRVLDLSHSELEDLEQHSVP